MKNVLLATDGSSYADEAAWFLAHLPHKDRLEVTVLTVLDTPAGTRSFSVDYWPNESSIAESIERARDNAVQAFKRVQQMFEGANVSLNHIIREGHRGGMIVKVAEELDSELVVVGARGHSTVERLLLGSASDYVATHAPCSVLVIRPTGLREHEQPLKILLGYEESDAAKAAMEELAEIRWGRQVDVRVVSVFVDTSGYFNEFPIDTTPLRNNTETHLHQAADRLRRTIAHVKADLVESNHIGEGLVQYAEKNQCDLLVVGETQLNLIGRLLLGSVSCYVLRHSPSSIWIARNRIRKSTTAKS